MKIGERIKQRRTFLGMSVDELAEKLHKNRATVYRYESSEIEKLPTTVLEPLAEALNTTPGYLMGWEDDKPNAKILSAGENKPAARQLTDRQEKIVNLFDLLTEPQQDNIIGRAETFAEQNENDFQRQESV